MTLLINQRRTQQPQHPVGIDWGNPITKGLVLVVSGDRTWSSASGSSPLAATNNPSAKVSRVGRTLGFGTTEAGNTNSLYSGAVLPGITSGARSGIAMIFPRSAGGGSLGRVFQNAAGTGIDVANSEALWMNASNQLVITACATTGTSQIAFNALTLNTWQTVGFSQDRTVINAIPTAGYVNGLPWTMTGLASTNTGSFSSASQGILIGNRSSDLARTFDGQIALIAYFDRYLTPSEHASLGQNPWQIFSPAVT